MESSLPQLSHEEFERIQNQLLELKTRNYWLEEQNRKYQYEYNSQRVKSEELEKQLSRAQTVAKINPLSLARNIANKVDNKLRDKELENVLIDNENLLRKIETQEQEFRVTNDTLKSEITSLLAINEKLENEVKLLQINSNDEHTQPECDLGVNISIIGDDSTLDPHISNTFQITKNTLDQQNSQLSFAILAEKEQLELKVCDLQELVNNLRKENQLITTQLEELQLKCENIDKIQHELDECNNLIERQNILIEEMREHKKSLQESFKSDCDKLLNEWAEKVNALELQLNLSRDACETYECTVDGMSAKLSELENVKLENDKLINELDSYKEELSYCKSEREEKIENLLKEKHDKLEQLKNYYELRIAEFDTQCDDYRSRISHLEIDTKKLNQQILDSIEDRKIHEKKGVAMVKELKRQLHSERKRAEKLQEKLQEVLNESTSTTFTSDIQRKASTSVNGNGNDSSSVGSWSFMSAKDNSGASNQRTSSMYSGSEGRDATPPYSPTNDNPSIGNASNILEQENTELVSRLTQLQQEKWLLEEKINHLELGNAAMTEDILRKTQIIQYYCMEGRADPPHASQSMLNDKLTVKRVVDFIKDKGDENMREINRKVQRMLEETLTKNMHLQHNLETMSNEVFRLNKLIDRSDKSDVDTT